MKQPVDTIDVARPSPSLLTSARDRTNDGFGAGRGRTLEDLDSLDDAEEAARIREQLTSWQGGIAWLPLSCQPSHGWPACPDVDPDDSSTWKQRGVDRSIAGVESFTIYTPLECGPTLTGEGLPEAADALTVAHTAFRMARNIWLGEDLPEYTLVNGVERLHPTLRAHGVNVGGGPHDLDDAIAILLHEYSECTGGNGGAVLHVPDMLIPFAQGGGAGGATVARAEGNLLRGPLGSVVSPGPGYPFGGSTAGADGYGPITNPEVDDPEHADFGDPAEYEGNATDEAWVYVSGPVEYALGRQQVLPFEESERRLDRRMNVYEVIAERKALVRFDPCCVRAALVTNPAGAIS